jgi:hypothetical protein
MEFLGGVMTMAKNLSDKAKAFLAKGPYYIGIVAGHTFYEHPTYGDESPLVMITPEGKVKVSTFWDMPSREELTA